MKHLLFLLPLITLFFGCGTEPTETVQTFSLRDSLQTSVITIEVPDFDESVDPIVMVAYWDVWHNQNQESHELFIDPNGQTSFIVQENIIRSYNLIYGESFLDILVRPGEDLQIQLLRDTTTGDYTIYAPDAPLTNQAAEIITVLKHPIWPVRDSLTKGITDLDSLLAINEGFAEQRRERLKELWASGKYTDPLLLEYANSYIDHQVRYDLNYEVMSAYELLGSDSILTRYLMPNAKKTFTEPSLVDANMIGDLDYEMSAVTRFAYASSKKLPKQERRVAYYTKSIHLIDSLYDGFLQDMFLARVYSLQLTVDNPAPQLMADAERFLRTTPYPGLSEPIRKQLSVLAGEIEHINRYEQQLTEIPAGLDTPIPKILAEHAGKVIILDFWATWCSPCISEMKNSYPAFMKKYDPEEVAVVFLARTSPENLWREQISKLEFSAIHLRTDKEQTAVVNKLFGISGIPHHTIFDQQGKLVKAKTNGPGHGLGEEVNKLLGM